jgi:hypothetical protein
MSLARLQWLRHYARCRTATEFHSPSEVSIRRSSRSTSSANPSALIAVTTREVADAVRVGKSVRGEIGLFDPESGVELFPPLEVGSTVTATGLSPDSGTLVIGDSKGQVYVIDAIDRELLQAFDSGHGIVGHRMPKVVPASKTKGLNFGNWSKPKIISSEQARARDKAVQGSPWSAEHAEDYEREKRRFIMFSG